MECKFISWKYKSNGMVYATPTRQAFCGTVEKACMFKRENGSGWNFFLSTIFAKALDK